MTKTVDLNLLVVLEVILTERNVTRAAERLGLSQPATSLALGKLRRHFGDDLLIRVGNQYRLTPLAAQLLERTRPAIAATNRVFHIVDDFDAAESVREFTVIMSDYALAVLAPSVCRILDDEAPGIRLTVHPTNRENVDAAADTLRTVDLLVLPHGIITDLPYLDLFEDDWVCLVSADNNDVGDELSTAELSAMPWVVTYNEGTAVTTAVRELRAHGVELNVRMAIESYLGLPAVVAGTRRVALVQRLLADALVRSGTVRIAEAPFRTTPLIEALWWHPSNTVDPGHRWLRRVFADASSTVVRGTSPSL